MKNVEIAKVLDLTESNVGVILLHNEKLKKNWKEGIALEKRIEDRFSIDIDALFKWYRKIR